MELLQRLKPGMIIYVSCNPATLARDLGHIVPSGYTIQSISPFDMFPHTSHLETLVVLTRVQKRQS